MAPHQETAGQRQAGRHSRPKPLGRFRLPTLRVSGAAMAMSTVVGISLATTWLVDEEGRVGRAPRISSVGASAPPPSHEGTSRPAAVGTAPRPTPSPTTGRQPAGPRPSHTEPHSEPPGDALTGRARAERFGPSGVRHTVTLSVTEPLTALQVELRLKRPEVLPGSTPWSSLPAAVVTVTQERSELVYRFTLPPGVDVHPGSHTFGVRGTRHRNGREATQEHWVASAFGIRTPRAVAARGTFR